ncbi:hypothetical protein M0R72_16195 [Candidatus Pacearchaeota archaeon]|jgi:hypothetical protein|nr:hypothetical protein [Candidatus Pacearchaeota archaeon]
MNKFSYVWGLPNPILPNPLDSSLSKQLLIVGLASAHLPQFFASLSITSVVLLCPWGFPKVQVGRLALLLRAVQGILSGLDWNPMAYDCDERMFIHNCVLYFRDLSSVELLSSNQECKKTQTSRHGFELSIT